MSTPDRSVDLAALARPSSATAVPAPRRRWLWALLPILLLVGFLLVFFDAARDFLTDATVITVVRPRTTTESSASAGSIVFQTAGWVEPDPYPTSVTALAEGVVEKMLVDEGDVVKKDQPIAELVSDDARIAVENALASRAKARADAAQARIELANAEEAFDAAIEVTRARDEAKAAHRARAADLARLDADTEEAAASLKVAEADLETQRFLRKEAAVGPWQVELAEAKRDEAKARVTSRRAAATKARAEVDHAAATLAAAQKDVQLRLAEKLRIDTAKVAIERADANVQLADAVLADARLRSGRMSVLAPDGGVVLTRDAQPGSTVGPARGPLCTLYKPEKLRVRVDVPQGQVSNASRGQRAEINCDVRRGKPYEGRVLRIIDAADIAKVTLEVQIAVVAPDGRLKPDMLCQVTVYSDAKDDAGTPKTAAVRIPSRCLVGSDAVWVIDPSTGLAARRKVEIRRHDGDDVVVTSGLNLTDKVIDRGASNLTEGARVKLEGDR